MDNLAYAIAVEEISRGCASLGVCLSAHHSLYCAPVEKWATPEQKERWLTPYAAGEKVGARDPYGYQAVHTAAGAAHTRSATGCTSNM